MSLDEALEGLKPPPPQVRCTVCGQVLKHPASIERQMGPVCASKEGALEQEYQDANPEEQEGEE